VTSQTTQNDFASHRLGSLDLNGPHDVQLKICFCKQKSTIALACPQHTR